MCSTPKTFGSLSVTAKQVIFALIVAASKLQTGFVIGWSTVLPKIEADTTTSFSLTERDITWLISMPGIAGILGALATGPLIEMMGPKRSLQALLLLAGILWLIQAFTPFLSVLYLGWVCSCLVYTALGPLPAVLITEISEPRIRGFLLNTSGVVVALGQLIMSVMAFLLPWDVATAVCAAPITLTAVLTYFVPESPYWLARQGREDAALKSLNRVRTPTETVSLELKTIICNEGNCQTSMKDQIKQLARPRNYRPVLLLTAIFILRELGGQYVVFSYTVYLFRKAGVGLDAFVCTVLVGVVKLVFAVVGAAVGDRVGRRPLLIATSLVCGAAEIFGAVFLLVDVPGSSWVPLAAVMIFVSSYGLGIGPIPWALIGELIPTPVRSFGSSLCIMNLSVFSFVISFIFPYLLDIGLGFALVFFASAHAILTLLLCAFLPETRGRSLSDLEDLFNPTSGN